MKFLKLILVPLAFAAFHGCSTTIEKNVDQRVSEETITSRSDLQTEAQQVIEGSPDLSADQKDKLSKLRVLLTARTDEINKESVKLRSVLIKNLLSPAYSMTEVDLIEGRLKKLEDKRLTAIFESVDNANLILGRENTRHAQLMRTFLETDPQSTKDQ